MPEVEGDILDFNGYPLQHWDWRWITLRPNLYYLISADDLVSAR
jgi:hypothetical protein